MARLILVPSPIGNLEDITLRAIRILKESDLILAEDTRNSGLLLKHLGITKPLRSYHAHNEHQQLTDLVSSIQTHQITALLSDAGTPGISDPGFLLVRHCIQQNIPVECLPGPTAFVPALINSGLPCNEFSFYGFLPQKKGRKSKWEQLKTESKTIVLYESPFRILKLVQEIIENFGAESEVSVSRELTKIHEETIRGKASEVYQTLQQKNQIKGEIVVIIKPIRP